MKNIKGWLTGGTLAAALMMGTMVAKADPGVIYGVAGDSSARSGCVSKADPGVIYGKSTDGVIYGLANTGVIYGLDGVIYGIAGVIYGDKDTCPAS